jgi:PAS domain S-box-containing protein
MANQPFETYLHAVLKQAPLVLFSVNPQGLITLSMGRALEPLGLENNELTGQNVFDLYKDFPWIVEPLKKVRRLKLRERTSGAVPGTSGDVWYDVQLAPLLDEKKQLLQIFGVAVDVTGEKRSQLLSEQHVAAMRASIDGIAMISPDEETLAFVNEAYARLFGYEKPEELIGKTWRTLHAMEDLGSLVGKIIASLERDGCWKGEVLGRKKSGFKVPLEVSLTRISREERRGFISVARDITDRKREELRRGLVGSIGEALARSIDCRQTIQEVANLPVPSFASWTIICIEPRLSSETALMVVGSSNDRPEVEALLKDFPSQVSESHCQKQVLHTGECEYLRDITPSLLSNLLPDAEQRLRFAPLRLSSSLCVPLCAREKLLGAMSFFRGRRAGSPQFDCPFDEKDLILAKEIGARVALAIDNSNLLRETQEAVRAREDLIASVSHDLKNPLSSIAVNIEMISSIADIPPQNRRLKKLAEIIRLSVDRMMSLIGELLECEKIRGGPLALDKSMVSLHQLVSSALGVFEPLAYRKSIQLKSNIMADDTWVLVDRERILQVLSNLIGNALKFTDANGVVQVTVEKHARELHFRVSDTGQGIPQADLAHVFDRYWQAKKTAKHGTGIGLSIARAIVEAHGGRIWAESVPHRGSTFSFTLPIQGDLGAQSKLG